MKVKVNSLSSKTKNSPRVKKGKKYTQNMYPTRPNTEISSILFFGHVKSCNMYFGNISSIEIQITFIFK